MIVLRFLLFALFLLPIIWETGFSQRSLSQTPPEDIFPWHGYKKPEMFDQNFVSIVNHPEVEFILGSGNLSPYGSAQTVAVRLPFRFLLNRHRFSSNVISAQQTLRVAITGAISTNANMSPNPTMDICPGPYHLQPIGINGSTPEKYYHLLAPFWGEFTSAGVQNGGIWTRLETLPDRQVFTIEWRVRHIDDADATPLSFQVKFVRFDDLTLPNNYWIEYHYDHAAVSSIPQPTPTQPGYHGAFIGMKHQGQSAGDPSASGSGNPDPNEGHDGDWLMIITNPTSYPNEPAFTRLETRTAAYIPDWFAYSSLNQTGQASPLFHYAFPGKNYRSKPVEIDVSSIGGCSACRSAIPSSDSTIQADTTFFSVGETLWIGGYFTNQSTADLANVPVRAMIYSGTTRLVTLDTTIAFLGFGDSVGIRFPGPLSSTITNDSNLYTAVIIARHPNDQDRSNDTTTFNFIIQAHRDVMPMEILQPELRSGSVLKYYPARSNILVRGVFFNAGTRLVQDVPVGCRILDSVGKTVYTGTVTVPGVWDVGERRTVEIGPWMQVISGTYTVELFSALNNDNIPENDTLSVHDSRSTWRSTSLKPSAERFRVAAAGELEVGTPGVLPHQPGMNRTYQGTAPVMITLRNNGALDAVNQPVQVIIRNSSGAVVYDNTVVVPNLPGGGSIHYQVFPTFTPSAAGTYTLQATSNLAGDALPANNTATWSFVIEALTSVEDDQRDAQSLIVLTPNPARGEAWLSCTIAQRTTAEITVLDMQGRRVIEAGEQPLESGRAVRLDLQDIPAGIYAVRLQFRNGAIETKRLVVVR